MRKISNCLIVVGLACVIGAGVLTGANIREDQEAAMYAKNSYTDIVKEISRQQLLWDGTSMTPDYLLKPGMEMPTVELDQARYIGIIEIPSLGIELPVLSDCSTSNLKCGPCRYDGSIYDDNCIIAGHNYRSHFGTLSSVVQGAEVVFTDIDGNRFSYIVKQIETIDGTDIDGAHAGEWDLTLFTCTIGGQNRIMVRCTKTEAI